MPESQHRYDVAISLLSQDQEFAEVLEQELRAVVRGEIFLYSRRQDDLAANGELVTTFTRVFREEARIVVILYRPRWGQTPYTSIEEDAIKSRRALTTSARFIVLVSMEPPHTPEWYPGNSEFWLNPGTFSPPAIAAIISERVHEFGGEVGRESPLDRARRLQSFEARQQETERRLQAEGPARLPEEFHMICRLLEAKAGEITRQSEGQMRYSHRDRTCGVTYRWPTLTCTWARPYLNSLDGACLTVGIQNWNPVTHSHHDFAGETRSVLEIDFTLALDSGGSWGWKPEKRTKELGTTIFLTSAELVDWMLSELIERGHQDPPHNRFRRRF